MLSELFFSQGFSLRHVIITTIISPLAFEYNEIIFYLYFSEVEKKMELVMKHREERASVAYELEKEKHVLRQLQGNYHMNSMQKCNSVT